MPDQRDYPVHYNAVFKDGYRYERQERVYELMNTKGQSKTAMVNRIFDAGLPVVEKEIYGEEEADRRVGSIEREMRRIAKKKALMEKLSVIYEDRGADAFIVWCQGEGQIGDDVLQEFLTQFTWRAEELEWPKRARSWLHEYHYDGKPCSTTKVKRDAIETGIITKSPDDWARLRALASRMGLTKTKHGVWQAPKKT